MDLLNTLLEKKRVAQDKDIKDREGTQPSKYYAKDAEGDDMAKSTKQARARHFEKGTKKDDDDPSAYEPAPGDKSAKTKKSQHTKKFAKMYGESLWDNIRAKRARGEKMRSKGEKGAPTDDQIQRAKGESVEEKVDIKKALRKVKGLSKKQMEVLASLPQSQLVVIAQQLSGLVMGEELEEGKMVAPAHKIIQTVSSQIQKKMEELYRKRESDGVKLINQLAQMVGMTVSDKMQKKGTLFLRMGDALEENATVDAALLKAKQADEMERLKNKQETELEALKDRHDRENRTAELAKEKETQDDQIKKQRDAERKTREKQKEKEVDQKKKEQQSEERDYKKEYANYHSKPEQIKRRAKRNEARRILKDRKDIKGKDVHHKDNNPMNNDKSNLSIVSQNYNRKEPRLREVLDKNASQQDYIDDFIKSDAPQFKGKSKDKIIKMAVAAYRERNK